MACSQPKTKPAHPKMKKLKNMTISPTENGILFDIKILKIYVPSNAPQYRMTKPTPAPSIMPPKTVASNGSVVIGSRSCSLCSITASRKMLNREEKKKLLPIYLYPKKRKGRLSIKTNIPKLMWVI